MSKRKILLSSKIKLSLVSSLKVFKKPSYVVLAILGSMLTVGLILWALNLEVLTYIIFKAPISVADKLILFRDIYSDIYTNFSEIHEVITVLFSVLFGLNLALLIFVIKNRGFKKIPKKSGFGGLLLAVVGGGCVACGTSLIAPLLASIGGVSTAFFRELSLFLNLAGSLLIIYSIYKLGLVASYIFAKMSEENEKKH